MYLLYLDESGTHGGSPAFVLAGLAVHEQDAWYLQRRLSNLLDRMLPKGLDPLDFELHAAEIKSPVRTGQKRPTVSVWQQVPVSQRFAILKATYRSIATYACRDASHPVALFGAVVETAFDPNPASRKRLAYEEVLHRFDEMLGRGSQGGGVHQRGLVIHDRGVVERDIQGWTHDWRHIAGRLGKLTHLSDVPLFADSRASRLIQAADFVSWALWRRYGLQAPDDRWISPLWPKFDAAAGVMHGCVHVHRDFKSGTCVCEPCLSRIGTT